MGTAAVPAAIVATLPGTLVVDLDLDNARGGGPYTFRWQNVRRRTASPCRRCKHRTYMVFLPFGPGSCWRPGWPPHSLEWLRPPLVVVK